MDLIRADCIMRKRGSSDIDNNLRKGFTTVHPGGGVHGDTIDCLVFTVRRTNAINCNLSRSNLLHNSDEPLSNLKEVKSALQLR